MKAKQRHGVMFTALTAITALTVSVTSSASSTPTTVSSAAPGARTAAGAAAAGAAADPARVGKWSKPFQMGVGVAIHATLTRTGKVQIFQYAEGDALHDHTSWSGMWNPSTKTTNETPFTYNRDVFCTGHVILPGGRIFVVGGHDYTTGKKQDGVGVAETDIFIPRTGAWKRGPDMAQKRWYPTAVAHPNGKVYIFGGQAAIGQPSTTVEVYNPATGSMSTLPSSATREVGSYPRMNVMANGKILKSGPHKASMYFDPATSSWTHLASMSTARSRGSMVLLPGAKKILAVGGQPTGTEPPLRSAEILDTSAANPTWKPTGSLNHARLHANTVVLPNGKVLIVGGGTAHRYEGPVKIPEMYNPKTGKWTDMAPQRASRIYHSTALLLPDGRVLSAGQDDGPLATFGEIYSPPYLFKKGKRPMIAKAPKRVSYGKRFMVSTPTPRKIQRVTLIKAGTVTHSIDSDQRVVFLRHKLVNGKLSVKAPVRRTVATPGYYMMFLVNGKGVPSVAKFVRLR